jgi:hypothetical protein
MGKRRTDANHRRFLDEFECVKISRLRAMGLVSSTRCMRSSKLAAGKNWSPWRTSGSGTAGRGRCSHAGDARAGRLAAQV